MAVARPTTMMISGSRSRNSRSKSTAKKYNGLRALTKRLKGQQPGAEASIGKLISTELSQRMTKFADAPAR